MLMSFLKAGLAAVAALAVTVSLGAPASAGGLPGYRGSLKDGPPVHHYSAGPCYFRADIGYSGSVDPDVNFPVINNPAFHFIDEVSNVEIDDALLGEVGIGCGSGSRGWRAEFALGYRSEREITGEPPVFVPNDPIHATVSTYTAMLNIYKDLGRWRGIVPYVGVGIGVAYNEVDDVFFTQNPGLVNRIRGNSDLAFAWSVMAGFGYQISNRAVLDFGYRYIDFGSVRSDRADSAFFVNPSVEIDDLTAHELKFGLRYHFGHTSPAGRSLK